MGLTENFGPSKPLHNCKILLSYYPSQSNTKSNSNPPHRIKQQTIFIYTFKVFLKLRVYNAKVILKFSFISQQHRWRAGAVKYLGSVFTTEILCGVGPIRYYVSNQILLYQENHYTVLTKFVLDPIDCYIKFTVFDPNETVKKSSANSSIVKTSPGYHNLNVIVFSHEKKSGPWPVFWARLVNWKWPTICHQERITNISILALMCTSAQSFHDNVFIRWLDY